MQAKSFNSQGPSPAGTTLPLSKAFDVAYFSSERSRAGDLAGSTRPNDGSLMAMPQDRAKDNQLQAIRLDFASGKDPSHVVYTPWNDNTMSLNSFLPVPMDDGTFIRHEGSRFAPHGDGEQSHTPKGEMRAERWPYGYQVPVGCLPACKSNPRRRRRRFTNGEKSIISYKRKVGVCRDCRQAKRKVSLSIMSVFFC